MQLFLDMKSQGKDKVPDYPVFLFSSINFTDDEKRLFVFYPIIVISVHTRVSEHSVFIALQAFYSGMKNPMRPEVKLIIDALNAVIDETADFNCYLDKIEFLEAENRVLVSTPVEQDVKASRNNKYILRDNFFKKFLGVPVENIEGKYAFLIPLDELSRLKIITEKMKALQNPPVQKTTQTQIRNPEGHRFII